MRRSDLAYTPFYCEENIWHLCRYPALEGSDRRVMFIGPSSEFFPMWNQRAGNPVCWDYHVVLLVKDCVGEWQVWDLDTTLAFPLSLTDYLAASFPLGAALEEHLQPLFRVLSAETYIEAFSSDRRHMLTEEGRWMAPPPEWPAICRDGVHNLDKFTHMTTDGFGELFALHDILALGIAG